MTEQPANLGALEHLLTFEEVDDAIDVLQRLIDVRTAELTREGPYMAHLGQLATEQNRDIETVIAQLKTARIYRAIPADAYDAAVHQLESPSCPEVCDTCSGAQG